MCRSNSTFETVPTAGYKGKEGRVGMKRANLVSVTKIIVGSHLAKHEINSLVIKKPKLPCRAHKRLGKQIW
jgi:hypothetical protein